jgi:hypothetical protein
MRPISTGEPSEARTSGLENLDSLEPGGSYCGQLL